MLDNRAALEAVVRHAVDLEDDYDDVAPTIAALAACGDITLAPQLHAALDRFLDEGNFYGRDLIASVLAGILGVAALPVLLRASACDLGDDQDDLQTEIIELLRADPVSSRRTVLEFVAADTAELRRVGLWALGFVVEAYDVELLATAAADIDARIRSTAIGSMPEPVGDDRAFRVLVAALYDRDEQVRVSAVSRLGYTGRADVVGLLSARTADPSPRVRSMIAYALGRLGHPEATSALLGEGGCPVPSGSGFMGCRCRDQAPCRLPSNSFITMFWRSSILDEAVEWLRSHGYDVVEFDAGSWTTARQMFEDVAEGLQFPDYFGRNLDALNDCMRDVASCAYGWNAEATGLVIVLRAFDDFATVDRRTAQVMLDIFAGQARSAILIGNRIICLVQSNDPQLSFEPVGAMPVMWNDAEWLDSNRGL